MKNEKNNKGITLMALVITIILLIILASVGIYSGRQVVKSAQFTAFSSELKIMQTQVNSLYEKKKNNEKILLNNVETDIEDIGTAISSISLNDQEKANMAFIASGIRDTSDYKYFDTDTIKSLNIEGVEGEFLVNIDKRSVVSYDGFEYEGKTYYTLEQLPDGLYNVEHNTSEQQPDFNVDYELLENGKCKISVNNINYNGNINKWQVKYKKENEEDWKQSNNYSFMIDELGNYRVKIANNNTESREKQIMAKTLPSEYQQVEYIKSTGTQYIDTELVTNNKNIKYEAEIKWTDTTTRQLFGANYGVYFGINSSGKYQFGHAGENATDITATNEEFVKIMVKYDYTTTPKKIEYQVDQINGIYERDLGSEQRIELFTVNENYSKSCVKYFKIYVDNVLVRDFIPCYRKSDNKPGLYDLVNNEFYTNQGTGDFDKGDDVIASDNTNDGMIIIINDL